LPLARKESVLAPISGSAFFRSVFGAEPNELQRLAIESMGADGNYIVVAPTGSGKTLVGYYSIFYPMALGARGLGVYIAPTRALGYEKYNELKEICKRVGCRAHIMNKDFPGSHYYFSDGRVVVTTPWKLSHYLSIQSVAKAISRATVVVDEIHNMTPEVELVVSILKTMGARIVGLSATLREEDAKEMAQWLSAALIMPELERPVPLQYHVARVYREVVEGEDGGSDVVLCVEGHCGGTRTEAVSRYVVSILRSDPEACVLVWAPTRLSVEECALEIADQMAANGMGWGNRAQAEAIASKVVLGTQHDDVLRDVIRRAPAAIHHGGLSPANRNLVQDLAVKRVFRVIATAYTLAQGVNLPAKHLVITTLRGHNRELLSATEFHQLAGRAGRPGLDKEGHVHVVVDTEAEFQHYKEIVGIRAAPVTSKIADRVFLTRILLKLASMGYRDAAVLSEVVKNTWYAKIHGEEGAKFIAELFGKIIDELIGRGYIENRDGRIWFPREYYYAATVGLLPEEKELADRADKLSEDEFVRAVVEASAKELSEREGSDRYKREVSSVVTCGLLAGQMFGSIAGELADKSMELMQAMQIYVGRAYGYEDPRYRVISDAVDNFASGRIPLLKKLKDERIPRYVVKAIARNYASYIHTDCIEEEGITAAISYLEPVHGDKKWFPKLEKILEASKCR